VELLGIWEKSPKILKRNTRNALKRCPKVIGEGITKESPERELSLPRQTEESFPGASGFNGRIRPGFESGFVAIIVDTLGKRWKSSLMKKTDGRRNNKGARPTERADGVVRDQRVVVMLSEDEIDKLNEKRGAIPGSAYIRNLVLEDLKK
jgi:hypothetical protein